MNTPQSTEQGVSRKRDPKRLLPIVLLLLFYAYSERGAFTGPMDAVLTFLLPVTGCFFGFFVAWRLKLTEVDSFRGWGWAFLAVGIATGAGQATYYFLKTAGVRELLSGAATAAVSFAVAIPLVALIDGPKRE